MSKAYDSTSCTCMCHHVGPATLSDLRQALMHAMSCTHINERDLSAIDVGNGELPAVCIHYVAVNIKAGPYHKWLSQIKGYAHTMRILIAIGVSF